jgi:hypothetical protein
MHAVQILLAGGAPCTHSCAQPKRCASIARQRELSKPNGYTRRAKNIDQAE